MNNSSPSFKKTWKQSLSEKIVTKGKGGGTYCVWGFHEPTNPKLKNLRKKV